MGRVELLPGPIGPRYREGSGNPAARFLVRVSALSRSGSPTHAHSDVLPARSLAVASADLLLRAVSERDLEGVVAVDEIFQRRIALTFIVRGLRRHQS